MIITATIRMSSIQSPTHTIDITWFNFWQFVEGCVAVTMVSSSAFRSLYIAHARQRDLNERPHLNQKIFLKLRTRRRARIKVESDETLNLPEIPRATLSGTSILFRGDESNDKSQSPLNEDLSEDENPLSMHNVMSTQGIGVEHYGAFDMGRVSSVPFLLLESDTLDDDISFFQAGTE